MTSKITPAILTAAELFFCQVHARHNLLACIQQISTMARILSSAAKHDISHGTNVLYSRRL